MLSYNQLNNYFTQLPDAYKKYCIVMTTKNIGKQKKMALLGGEYYFDVALFEENATVPLVYKTRYLTMFISGKYVGEGIVVLDHKWKDTI